MLKTAICYFSGSGNSFDVTLELCKYIDVESIFYIPNLDVKKLDEFEEVIIVSPIYQFSIPKNVQDFIRKLSPDLRYYVVLNYAGIIANAVHKVKKLFNHCHLELASIHTVIMPTTFSVAFVEPNALAKKILNSAIKKNRKIANKIMTNESKKVSYKFTGKLKRFVGYRPFAHYLSADSSCTLCQKCVSYCPTKNIHLFHGGIDFGEKCISCMGCYNRCEHVLYKGKKKKTYVNPNIDFKLMK
ncbi:MAG: EFR1 family ferrodoxin [Eubacteriales bacterium]